MRKIKINKKLNFGLQNLPLIIHLLGEILLDTTGTASDEANISANGFPAS